MVAWIFVSGLMLVAWLIGSIGLVSMYVTEEIDKQEFQVGCSISVAGLVFALLHVVVLALVVPAFVLYALYQSFQLLRSKPWKNDKEWWVF